jgi:nickel-dependent lactate racemase
MLITIPYGTKHISFNIPETNVAEVLLPNPSVPKVPPAIFQAIRYPIGTAPLSSLVNPRSKVVILCEDITRPTPLDILLPYILDELQTVGVSKENILIIFALGSHRPMTSEEMRAKLGSDIYESYQVVNSEFRDPSKLVYVGTTESGVDIYIDKRVIQADIKIGIGSVFPHPAAGYTGGAKILYPGVAGEMTVAQFHLSAALVDKNLFGEAENPVRKEMETWVDRVGLDFVVNAILTPTGEIYQVVAGHYVEAHRQGIRFCQELYTIKVQDLADAVIVSSFPADLDFWQAGKAIMAAEKVVKTGGTIVLVTPCYEGVGPHASFLRFCGAKDLKGLLTLAQKGGLTPEEILPLSVATLMHYARRRAEIIIISDGLKSIDIEEAGFKSCRNINDALEYVFLVHGKNAKIYVMPYGGHTCPILTK